MTCTTRAWCVATSAIISMVFFDSANATCRFLQRGEGMRRVKRSALNAIGWVGSAPVRTRALSVTPRKPRLQLTRAHLSSRQLATPSNFALWTETLQVSRGSPKPLAPQ